MRKAKVFISLLLLTIGASQSLFGNPKGFQALSGDATLSYFDVSTVEITTGESSIVQWDSFSIGEHETTRFIMPSRESIILNRVIGGDVSSLLGTLESNGKVFLINPNGVLVGASAVIDTASFIASSFDLLDEDLLQFAKNGAAAPVINLGHIISRGGDVPLIGSSVSNEGRIDALSFQEKEGRVYLIAEKEVSSSGIIGARGGEVQLLGQEISLIGNAIVDTSGDFHAGKIYIGGGAEGKDPKLLR